MVKEDGIEWTKLTQIILKGNTMESPKKSRHILMTSEKDSQYNGYLVRDIIPMPCDHIEWRKILRGSEQLTAILLHYCVSRVVVLLKPCCGGKEIPR